MSELVLFPVTPQYLAGPSTDGFHSYSYNAFSTFKRTTFTRRHGPYRADTVQPFPPLPNELTHYILCVAADRHPEIHSSLRLAASWVRELCQPYMRTAVVIKTFDKAVGFAHFMSLQGPVPFKVDAIWFSPELFNTVEEASVVVYIFSKCFTLKDVALSEAAYLALASAPISITANTVAKLTVHGAEPGHPMVYTIHERFCHEQMCPTAAVFPHVTQLVLTNVYNPRNLSVAGYPNLRAIAVPCYGSVIESDFDDYVCCLTSLRGVEQFVVIFDPIYKTAYWRWIADCRKSQKKLYILESAIEGDSGSYNDLSGWRGEATRGKPFWERAMEYTRRVEDALKAEQS